MVHFDKSDPESSCIAKEDLMARSSSISHPANSHRLEIHEWQVLICDGDVSVAGVLSYIEWLHNKKQSIDENHKDSNEIAELHNKLRSFDEDILIQIKLPELRKALFGLGGAEKKLSDALEKIALKGFITIHNNPDPKEKFDRTKYIRFYPEICNAWIRTNYNNDGSLINPSQETSPITPKGSVDSCKRKSRFGEEEESVPPKGAVDSANRQKRIGEKAESEKESYQETDNALQVFDSFDNAKGQSRFGEKAESILPKGVLINNLINNNNKINNNNYNSKLINQINCKKLSQFLEPNHPDHNVPEKNVVKTILDTLISEGFSPEEIHKPYAMRTIETLLKEGATLEIFVDAYAISFHTTQSKGRTFNINYLAKTVRSLLESKENDSKKIGAHTVPYTKKISSTASKKTHVFEHDLENARSWAGDLI